MEFEDTVERLEGLLEAQASLTTYSARKAVRRLIEAQVEHVQVRVFFHTLDALDFFNSEAK